MRARSIGSGLLLLVLGLGGCGGSIKGSGPDGSTPTGACASLGACECWAASDRCSMRTESCWCPSECNPNIACICGGGQFLGCEDKAAATACDAEMARVQTLCAGQPFVGDIGSLCASNGSCIAGCLAKLSTVDTCAQIDCSFCLACDCAGPAMPSAFSTCVNNCNLPPPPLR